MRLLPSICTVSTLALAALSVGCAGGQGPADAAADEYARRGPPVCSQQDYGALNMSIRTCVQDFGPSTLPEEMQMRQPYVVTVVDTPAGQFSNPLIWFVEVERDGEVIVDRRFSEEGDDILLETQEVEDGRVEIRSALPLTDEGELEPGTYEIRYRTEEGDEVGTTTIVVEPQEGESQEGEQAPEEQSPVEQTPEERPPVNPAPVPDVVD